MEFLRTPDERFENLPGYDFAPHYMEATCSEDATPLRMHYLDEGNPDAPAVLLLHGEPSWAYLYRKMIPVIVKAGCRVIAPDLIGFGRSDKPASRDDYSYLRHVEWMKSFLEVIDLRDSTLVCQDWGGLIGLRIAAEEPDRFSRIVAANTALVTGDQPMPKEFTEWQEFSQTSPKLKIGMVLQGGTVSKLTPEVIAAYDAPFPDDSYKEGARIFPALVPTQPDDPAAPANRAAWKSLMAWEKPFLTAFSDNDPITGGGDAYFKKAIPGAKGQPHTTIEGGGHFLQEDQGEAFAQVIVDFIGGTG